VSFCGRAEHRTSPGPGFFRQRRRGSLRRKGSRSSSPRPERQPFLGKAFLRSLFGFSALSRMKKRPAEQRSSLLREANLPYNLFVHAEERSRETGGGPRKRPLSQRCVRKERREHRLGWTIRMEKERCFS
jgi:hypothetical protein